MNRTSKKGERLQIKMTYVVNGKKFKTTAQRKEATVRALYQWFNSEGRRSADAYAGVHIVGTWRNPDNPNPAHFNWKTTDADGQSLSEFYRTFHGKNGALFAIYNQNLKDMRDAGTGKDEKEFQTKKPKPRRRIVSKVVRRKDGKKFVPVNRVAKRKAKKSVRSKPQRAKGSRKTGKRRKG